MLTLETEVAVTKQPQSGGVKMGKVSGGIHGSIIAGRDVRDVTITLGGRPVAADKEPNLEEFKHLLLDIQIELGKIAADRETLEKVSPSAPLVAEGVRLNVKDVAERVLPSKTTGEVLSIKSRLNEASSMMTTMLEGIQDASHGIEETGKASKPIADLIASLVDKLAIAALWAARLWSAF